MTLFGPFGLSAPFALLGLLALPVLWWLVRQLPPTPRRIALPTLSLLPDLATPTQRRQQPPWWLLALRLMALASLIVALAGPVWRPPPPATDRTPLLMVLDTGWTAAPAFAAIRARATEELAAAEQSGRYVRLATTAPPPGGWSASTPPISAALTARAVRDQVEALEAQPWPSDRATLARAIQALPTGGWTSLWITDGVADGGERLLADALLARGAAEIVSTVGTGPLAFRKAEATNQGWIIEVIGLPADINRQVDVVAKDRAGARLGATPVMIEEGADAASARIDVPPGARLKVDRLEIDGANTAAGVVLVDNVNRRPLVGLVSGERLGDQQPLRAASFYVRRAIEPYADLREGDAIPLIEAQAGLLLFTDVVPDPTTAQRILGWVRKGGVAVSFAGPRVAEAGTALEAAPLATGARAMGGALTWERPQSLQPFAEHSPFAGLIPTADVRVMRQVLPDARAGAEQLRPYQVWSRLTDGTPLITARRDGAGLLIMVHTNASPEWSSLGLSGLFVDLLRRLLPLAASPSAARAATDTSTYLLTEALNGYGDLVAPRARGAPVRLTVARAGPLTPPGFYQAADESRALNLASSRGPIGLTKRLSPLDALPAAVRWRTNAAASGTPLAPWAWALALALLMVDAVLAAMRGLSAGFVLKGMTRAAIVMAALWLVADTPAHAQSDASAVRMGFVRTTPLNDSVALNGLAALGNALSMRTAVRAAVPDAVTPGRDDIGRLALLYWPLRVDQAPLNPAAAGALRRYLENGGLIVIDTGRAAASPAALRAQLLPLGLPPLAPLSSRHVLARSFYLLQQFPGAVPAPAVWVEADSGGDTAVVSGVVLGGGDWARAWAEGGGGLLNDRQTEYALRFGINLMMYALTGTYKADQVHAAAILQRGAPR